MTRRHNQEMQELAEARQEVCMKRYSTVMWELAKARQQPVPPKPEVLAELKRIREELARPKNIRDHLRELQPGESATFDTIEQARSASAAGCKLYGKTFSRSGQTIWRTA